MLTRQRKEVIPSTLTLTGQGEKVKFNIDYNNLKSSRIEEMAKDENMSVVDCVLEMVSKMDTEYPLTKEGLLEMEDDRPGTIQAIVIGFHESRKVERAKNS